MYISLLNANLYYPNIPTKLYQYKNSLKTTFKLFKINTGKIVKKHLDSQKIIINTRNIKTSLILV